MAKYISVLPRTSSVRPKSEIYTPEQDDEHPKPFYMRSAPPPSSDERSRSIRLLTSYLIYKQARLNAT